MYVSARETNDFLDKEHIFKCNIIDSATQQGI